MVVAIVSAFGGCGCVADVDDGGRGRSEGDEKGDGAQGGGEEVDAVLIGPTLDLVPTSRTRQTHRTSMPSVIDSHFPSPPASHKTGVCITLTNFSTPA